MILAAVAATFSVAAMAQIVDVSEPAISSNGARVAFVAERADLPHNDYDDTLWIYDARARALKHIALHSTSVDAPAWTQDATKLGFLTDDAADTTQVFAWNAATGKVTQLTRGTNDVLDFSWSPDGKRVAFVRRDSRPKRTGEDAYRDAFEVSDEAYLTTAKPQPASLWTTMPGASARRVATKTGSVEDDPVAWTRDGASIVYVRVPDGIRAHETQTQLRRVNVDGGGDVALPFAPYADEPQIAPGGNMLTVRSPRNGDPHNAMDAFVMGIDGRGARDASYPLDRHVTDAAWFPNGKALLLHAYDGTSGRLYEQPLTGVARALPVGDTVGTSIGPQSAAADGTVAFVGTEAGRPSELYLLRAGASAPQRVTDFNYAIAALALGKVATVRWRSADGLDEDGVLTYPPNYVAGRRYPLVLRIHGGPTETSQAAFDPFYQLAASHGYFVFAPNYRGSSNAGSAFEHAIFNDASVGPGRDVADGISAVEKLGMTDPSKTCVSGWSYGGQLTSWMIGHYQQFNCAVTGAAVNDLVVDYTIADDLDAARLGFTQSPFEGQALQAWQAQSPITFFKNIRTPLLMLGNVYDVRVPIVEQYELFHALRDNGDNGPVRLADAYQRWLSWFDRYLK